MWNYLLIKSEGEYGSSSPTWTNLYYNSIGKRKQIRKEKSKGCRKILKSQNWTFLKRLFAIVPIDLTIYNQDLIITIA